MSDLSQAMSALEYKPPVQRQPFMGHYVPWRHKRLLAIVNRYGSDWFLDRRVLDLGCGHGQLGINLALLGAKVTFCDARKKYLDEIAIQWPAIPAQRLVCADLEKEWPRLGRFDMILHQGLMYHCEDWAFSLRHAAASADHIVLESEICDGSGGDYACLNEDRDSSDSAFNGIGVRPSADAVEEVLTDAGLQFERLTDKSCNSGPHVYDWPLAGTKKHLPAHRRWWWCWRDGHGPS